MTSPSGINHNRYAERCLFNVAQNQWVLLMFLCKRIGCHEIVNLVLEQCNTVKAYSHQAPGFNVILIHLTVIVEHFLFTAWKDKTSCKTHQHYDETLSHIISVCWCKDKK